jgi:hypothetical protein
MRRYLILIVVLLFISISASACDSTLAKPNPDPDQVEVDNQLWLTPLIPTDTYDPGPSDPQPGPFQYPLSLAELLQLGPEFDIYPGDWVIATPLYPNFNILSAKIHECNNQVYVAIEVKNNGPYYFQFISLGVSHGTTSFGQSHWEDPWVYTGSGSACPVPTTGWPSLAPGSISWIYQPVTVDPAFNDYHIHLSMCTYQSIPDACPYRYYLLTEDYSTKTPTPILMDQPRLKLKKLVLCWVGPGDPYEVVNSIPEGTEVELLGKGDKEGFLVVLEPKYQRECWMYASGADEVPEDVYRELMTFVTPLLPVGEVKGRVFKDYDGDEVFNNNDVGFPGAQVHLGPGTCGNTGQLTTKSTNNEGWYSFGNVTPGSYCLYVTKPTTCKIFSTTDSYNITVIGGDVIQKNFGLEGCR